MPFGSLELLLTLGADINVQDIDGYAALHSASNHQNIEAFNLLIHFNADATIINNEEETQKKLSF